MRTRTSPFFPHDDAVEFSTSPLPEDELYHDASSKLTSPEAIMSVSDPLAKIVRLVTLRSGVTDRSYEHLFAANFPSVNTNARNFVKENSQFYNKKDIVTKKTALTWANVHSYLEEILGVKIKAVTIHAEVEKTGQEFTVSSTDNPLDPGDKIKLT